MIDFQNVRKEYPGKVALDGVSFCIQPGEVCGLLGPNGAGKSTSIKILAGMLAPTSGSVSVAGFDPTIDPISVKRQIGFVPESGALYECLTPREYLHMVCEIHETPIAEVGARVETWIENLGLQQVVDSPLETLSKGNKQKALIAAALVHDPPVVLMDEPLNGLDVHATRKVKDLLRAIADQGRIVLYSSHLLDVVERLCSRVLILERGRLIADDSPESLQSKHPGKTLEQIFADLTDPAREPSPRDRIAPAAGQHV